MSRKALASVLTTVGLLVAAGGAAPVASASSFNLSSSTASPVGVWSSPLPNQPHITVHADGKMGGNDGCNTFGTTWREDKGRMIIETDEWISTMIYCGWEWFPAARSAVVTGDLMHIYNEHGAFIGALLRQ